MVEIVIEISILQMEQNKTPRRQQDNQINKTNL
jgi:hypothetical protein